MDLKTLLLSASSTLIATSGLLIVFGLLLIRLGRKDWHKRLMLAACALALVFVVIYLLRSALFPIEKYDGAHKSFYLKLLISHTVLSVINLPMAIITVYLALKGKFDKHKKIAPFTAILWIYVAASGWTVFFMNR